MSLISKIVFPILIFFLLIPLAFSQTLVNASVKWSENIILDTYTEKSSYCEPVLVNSTTKIENIGNLGVIGDLELKLFDPQLKEVYSNRVTNLQLNPLDKYIMNKSFYFEKNVTGLYTLNSSFSYDGKKIFDTYVFRIKRGIGALASSYYIIEKTVMPGDTLTVPVSFWLVYACYGAYVNLTKGGETGNWTSFSTDSFFLGVDDYVTVDVTFEIPPDIEEGTYTGYIRATAKDPKTGEEQYISIVVRFHVEVTAIFDMTVTIPPEKKEVEIGEPVYAIVTITKFLPPIKVDINLTYRIVGAEGIVDEKNETIAIETTLQRVPNLFTYDAPPGYYSFVAILRYKDVEVTAADVFRILPPPPPPPQLQKF